MHQITEKEEKIKHKSTRMYLKKTKKQLPKTERRKQCGPNKVKKHMIILKLKTKFVKQISKKISERAKAQLNVVLKRKHIHVIFKEKRK